MELTPVKLRKDYHIKPFNCGNTDLNGFLLENACVYLSQMLTVTFLLESNESTVAYFSLAADKISVKEFVDSRTEWNKFRKLFKNSKRISSYPAMKIARLAVGLDYKREGLGSLMLDYIKDMTTHNPSFGCRFLTVDAYIEAIPFYERNGFVFLSNQDVQNPHTRLMYYDLKKLI